MSHVESPKSNLDATSLEGAGILEGIEREASAATVKVTQEIAAAEMEVSVAQGAANEARHKEAGKEASARSSTPAQGTVEGTVAEEGIMKAAPTIGIAKNLYDTVRESASNPSKGADVASSVAGGGRSFEDMANAMKKKPSLHSSADSARSIAEKMGTTGDIASTKGAKSNAEGIANIKTAAIKQAVQNSYQHSVANEAVLGQVQAAKQKGPNTANDPQYAQGPGGMGGQRMAQNSMNQLTPNNLENGPRAPVETETV